MATITACADRSHVWEDDGNCRTCSDLAHGIDRGHR